MTNASAGSNLDSVPPVRSARRQYCVSVSMPVLFAEIAEAAFLSPDRFRHFFVEQTGMRFRPYVLWLRIEVALAAVAAGRNLTKASTAVGFADPAHFSRTFKRMFGIAPYIFQRDCRFV